MLLETSIYANSYDGQTKWMYFLIEDDGLLEKYNTIWDKVSTDIRKEKFQRWTLIILVQQKLA